MANQKDHWKKFVHGECLGGPWPRIRFRLVGAGASMRNTVFGLDGGSGTILSGTIQVMSVMMLAALDAQLRQGTRQGRVDRGHFFVGKLLAQAGFRAPACFLDFGSRVI